MKQTRKSLPPLEELNKYFYYDETSHSCLRWKVDRQGKIKKDDCAGLVGRKYFSVSLKSIGYKIHRIIWKMHYKVDPPEILDHIDGNTKNNKISNLREATNRQNSLNINIPKNNTTGVIGVYWMKSKRKWKVEIKHADGKLKYHGLYYDFE